MQKKIIFILIILIVSFQPQINAQHDDCCKSKLAKKGFAHYRLKKLGKEYQFLKKKDHKCCDKFGSDLQKLMQVLGDNFNKPGQDTTCVLKIMGIPDANEVPKQYGNFITGNEKIMVYWWRSWHDFFYIISENGKIKYAKWFYALE